MLAYGRGGVRRRPNLYPTPKTYRRYTRPDEETVDEEGGGEGKGDAGESEFGFVTVDRSHTLKSFASYADWVKALHFSEPLPQVRHSHSQGACLCQQAVFAPK